MARSTQHQWSSFARPSLRRSGQQRPTRRRPYRRRLRIEPLEDRRLLAVVVVDTLDDTVNFADGVTSLREAIFATNTVAGADTIEFAPSLFANGPATILLTQGELKITDSLAINGPILIDGLGVIIQSFLTIDASGNDPTPHIKNGDGSRIFNIEESLIVNVDGPIEYDGVSISGLTLTGGDAGLNGGGAILAQGKLTVANCTISGNSATGRGGGIFGRSMTVINSSIRGNSAQYGGGLATSLGIGELTLTGSTVDGNSASSDGGGIFGTFVTVNDSTISGNLAGENGGGIRGAYDAFSGGSLSATNTTIHGNTAGVDGGGIFKSQTAALLSHTIIAGNTRGAGEANDVTGGAMAAFSLIGVVTGSAITDNGGNLIGTAAAPIDPLLGPLADNGGPTFTHALLAGSPAINRGDLTAVAGVGDVPEFDQRGASFGRVFGGRIDIGAFEYQAASDLNLVVDTLVDESDGNYALGDLSLREAILIANTYSSVDTIRFAPGLSGGTILLTMGELLITDSTTIEGLGANLLTLRAFDPTPGAKNGDGHRILNIDDGNSATMIDVSISGLKLTGGDVGNSGNGGAIFSREQLTVTDSAITGNSASTKPFESYASGGGGIYNGGHLSILRSTITANSTNREGGAIRSTGTGAWVVVTDSTISGNSAGSNFSGEGGGIAVLAGGSLTVTGSTISGNTSNDRGGGISLRVGATLTVTGSTISGNSTQSGGGGIASYRGNVTVTDSTISGNSVLQAGWGGGGIFNYRGNVMVTGSTISGNSVLPSGWGGGGILSYRGSLTIVVCTISNNSATGAGGIFSRQGILTVSGSTISGNTALGEYGGGGGVVFSYGSGTISDSTISGNSALGMYARAGGLSAYGGAMTVSGTTFTGNTATTGGGISSGAPFSSSPSTLSIIDSTISSNSAVGGPGGGIYHGGFSGNLTIAGSTISGNTTNGQGGGLYLKAYYNPETFTIRHSTIAFNSAYGQFEGGGQFGGGGIFVHSGSLVLDHSIVAMNDTGSSFGRDLTGFLGVSIDARYSLIGTNAGSGLAPAPVGSPDAKGNLIGGPNQWIDPLLVPLGDNGGRTQTHAMAASSPARNAGDPGAVGGVGTVPEFDQRGAPFVRVFGGRIDIGAYERQTVQNPSLVVDTLEDETDGDYSPGNLSLREAIGLANGSVDSAETITFAPSLTAGGPATIHLTGGELAINDSLSIVGPGASLLTIDASASDPTPNQNNFDGSVVFNIDDGIFTVDRTVSISGLTITGGDGGGGIMSAETLTVLDCAIVNNNGGGINAATIIVGSGKQTTIIGSTIANNNGGGIMAYVDLTVIDSTVNNNTGGFSGGIHSASGNLVLTRSQVSGNVSHETGQGGGIYAAGTLTVTASTISGNSAYHGGGIFTRGFLTVTDSTISGNRASGGSGGGIFTTSHIGTTIANSTISGNFATTLGGGIHFYRYLTVSHSTITGNRANTNGGGISNSGYGSVQLDHTIVAGNTRGTSTRNDLFGTATLAFSLLGVNTGTTIGDNGGNQIGTSSAPVNAMLGPLADNGGQTMTHALLPGSPAIDAGDPAAVAGVGGVPEFDQRGAPFGRVFGGRIDIGAFESQPMPLPGDFNNNGAVDNEDLTLLLNNWGLAAPPTPAGWVGMPPTGPAIDNDELTLLLNNWGSVIGGGATSAEPLASGDGAAGQPASVSRLASEPYQPMEPRGAVAGRLATRGAVDTAHRPTVRDSVTVSPTFVASRRDDALVAWLALQPNVTQWSERSAAMSLRGDDDAGKMDATDPAALDAVFATLAGNREG